MYERYGLYIDGGWRPAAGGATYAVVNPANEEPLGNAPAAGAADVHAAIAAAEKGLAVWRKVQPWERARLLRRIAELMTERKEDIARAMTLEIGKPIAQSRAEIQMSIEQFEWFAEEIKRIYGQTVESRLPGGRIFITHQPVGIVAAFTAWNFPGVLVARKVAPALAAGCSIIVRPSEQGPGTVMAIFQCLHDAGLPAGVVNLLTGKTAVITPILMAAPAVRKVSLTGSTDVGKQLIRSAADTVKRVSMELGGHAPVIVWDDVDPVNVADLAVQSKFRNCGQVCVSPTRFYIHKSKAAAFTERFVGATRKLKLGDGLDPATDIGPLTTRKRLEAIEQMVEDTKASGAKLLAGGRRPPEFNRGFFYEPTVFGEVPDSARVMRDEPFGPIAPITTFEDFDEVIARANALPLGLASYVFTTSLKRAHETSEAIEAGMVSVNTFVVAQAEAPFGGVKESGYGREGGSIGILDYLDTKYTNMVLA